MKTLFKSIANKVGGIKDTFTNAKTIDAYEDAFNVYKYALKGKQFSPEEHSFKPLDVHSDNGKAFIQQAKLNLDKADQAMSDAFSPD